MLSSGSMIISDPQKIVSIIKGTIEQTNIRIIFSKGWTSIDLENIPDRLLVIDSVPHRWLFPKTAGIIHHGGAGTTAAALMAGVPQMIFPKTADQPFGAERVHRAGLSLKPEKLEKLSSKKLKEIITFFQSAGAVDKALKKKHLCSAEKGIAKSVELIQKLMD